MARKRPKFDRAKAVKAIARKRVGRPPAARALEERATRSKPKHKKQLLEGQVVSARALLASDPNESA
ncbi:MAG: hypothetical protein ACR2IV_03500 [Bryobacteraceae bacterium]